MASAFVKSASDREDRNQKKLYQENVALKAEVEQKDKVIAGLMKELKALAPKKGKKVEAEV